MGITLPQKFIEKMESLLGSEYEAWFASYERERLYGLRVNALKLSPESFLQLSEAPERLRSIPWTDEGFYYTEGDRPGKHTYYHAGLYYIQEPSAMVPAELLHVQPGDRVLDLCAAPGGKSTQLAAKLQGQGVLVSNDNARERTKVLAKNIELAGVRNAVVLSEEPAKLAGPFAGYFNKILVDAPCSGEGMFRKDESMIAQWEKHSVERCSVMQRDILRYAADMLAPGGTLVYSTCTFSPEENESQIAALLADRPELEAAAVELKHGWMHGRPEWVSETAVTDAAAVQAVAGTVRLWPHLTAGEGHYAAVLRHKGTEAARDFADETVGFNNRKPGKGDYQAASERGGRDRNQKHEKKGGIRRSGQGGSGGNGKQAEPIVDPLGSWKTFAEEQLVMKDGWRGNFVVYGSRVYLQPPGLPPLDGLQVIRPGWYLGDAKAHRFEPSQALAMGLRQSEALRSLPLQADEDNTQRYLRGETIHPEAPALAETKGYVLVLADGYPLGWGKWDGAMLKNELAPGWRRN